MSSRTPRRAFAASFVVTMAALPGCRVNGQADHRTQPVVTGDRDHRGDGTGSDDQTDRDHRGDGDTSQTTPPSPDGTVNPNQQGANVPPKPEIPDETRPGIPPANVPSTAAMSWVVMKRADGTCAAAVEVSCTTQRPGSCNPPAPKTIACPAGVTITPDHPVHVSRAAGDTECFARYDTTCHPGATCNPPPPRKVACP